jgi:hypothetical protein
MATKIRHCVVAPSIHHYEYCGHCGQNKPEEMWRTLYCSENCMNIFNVCSKYVGKKLTVQEARDELDKLDIPAFECLAPGIRSNIEEIYCLSEPSEAKKNIDEPDPKPKRGRKKKTIVNED